MDIVEAYKWLGLVALVTSWTGIILVLTRWESDRTLSISYHAAKTRSSFLTLALLQSVACLSFILFGVGWVVPALDLPVAFSVCFVAMAMALFVAAWVPTVEGLRRKVHNMSAYGATLLLLPTIMMVATSPRVSLAGEIAAYAAAASMTIIFAILMTTKRAKNSYLYLQCGYWLAFDIGLFMAVFVR